MSTYVLMRILESAPGRYDLGMRILTLGRLDRAYDRLAGRIGQGHRVLDIGCGTGALTLRAARRGATVKGIDINAEMLEIARRRISAAGLGERVELSEAGVAELDGEEAQQYDVVMSGLCFSELSDDETAYALKEAARLLRPGGLLLLADEIRPRGFLRRSMHWLARLPLAALTYAVTQQTTRAAVDLPGNMARAGFTILSLRTNLLGSFGEFVAQKQGGDS